MLNFLKRHYAFLYYKHFVLKKGITPTFGIRGFVGFILALYLSTFATITYGFIVYFYKINFLSQIPLKQFQIISFAFVMSIIISISYLTKKVKHQDFNFDYKRDNIFYTIYEVLPFILFYIAVLTIKSIVEGNN